MRRVHLLGAVAAAAVAALAWDLLRPAPAPATAQAPPAPAKAAAPAPVAAAKPLGPADVGRAPNFLRPAAHGGAASALEREFATATRYKALYERLRGTPEGRTPEGQFYLQKILRECASIGERKAGGVRRPQGRFLESRRERIAADYAEGDPRRAQRLAAVDRLMADPCEGLEGLATTEGELAALLAGAVNAGDPKARAYQVEQDMWQARRASGRGAGGPTLNDAQLETLRSALGSRDPEAMVIAGRVLSNTFGDVTVRLGADQEPIEPRAFRNAAMLLACEYGYACDESNNVVVSGCAYQGHCGVGSLADYMFYYGASPYDAQLLDRYRNVLRQAVDSGDWSALGFTRGARPAAPPAAPAGR